MQAQAIDARIVESEIFSNNPVLDLQTCYPLKLLLVVGYDNKIRRLKDNEWASQFLAMLWCRILPGFSKKIVGRIGQQLIRPRQSFGWFTKHDFIATSKDFKHLALDGEFLRQPDRLTIS